MNPKLDVVQAAGTHGANVSVTNADVIAKLSDWDKRYGIDVSEADWNRVMVTFQSIPDDLESLAPEIYKFCPDVVDQHMASLWCGYHGDDQPPADIQEILGELDPDEDGYGLEILKRWIKHKRTLPLWWD